MLWEKLTMKQGKKLSPAEIKNEKTFLEPGQNFQELPRANRQ
jgi:hypothetical protein